MTINKSDCNNNNSAIVNNNHNVNVGESANITSRHVVTPNKDLIGSTNHHPHQSETRRAKGSAGGSDGAVEGPTFETPPIVSKKKNILLRTSANQNPDKNLLKPPTKTNRPRPKSLIIPIKSTDIVNTSNNLDNSRTIGSGGGHGKSKRKVKVKIHSIQIDGHSTIVDTPSTRRANTLLINQPQPQTAGAICESSSPRSPKLPKTKNYRQLQRHKSCPGTAAALIAFTNHNNFPAQYSEEEVMPPARSGGGAAGATINTTTATNVCQMPTIENCENLAVGPMANGTISSYHNRTESPPAPAMLAGTTTPPPPPPPPRANQKSNAVIDWKTKLNKELLMYQHLFNSDIANNQRPSKHHQQPPLRLQPHPQQESSQSNSSDVPNGTATEISETKIINNNNHHPIRKIKTPKQSSKQLPTDGSVLPNTTPATTTFTIKSPSPIHVSNNHSDENSNPQQCDSIVIHHNRLKQSLSANSTPRHKLNQHSRTKSTNTDGATKTVSNQTGSPPFHSNGGDSRNVGSNSHRRQLSNSLRRQNVTIVTPYEKALYAMENDKTWQKEIAYGRRIGFYRFRGDIGNGNFSQVKVAMHTLTKEKVAVKILDKSRLDLKTQKMLGREIRTMETLHHPNLIRIFEVVETLSKHFIVMELAPGGELFQVISTHGRFTETEAKFYFSQIVAAIDHMHQHNLIHRDIKAENVFFADSRTVKVGDFGFSTRIASREELLSTFCGSPPYAAPELFRDESYRGPFVDYWALGVLLYFIVTATMPFRAQTIVALKKLILECRYDIPTYVSVECCQLIAGLLQLDPSKRYSLDQARQTRWLRNRTGARSIPKYDLRSSFTKLLKQRRKSTLTLSTEMPNYPMNTHHKPTLSSARSRESNSDSSNSLTGSSSCHTAASATTTNQAKTSANSDTYASRQRHSVGGFYDSLHLPINNGHSNANVHHQPTSIKSVDSLTTIGPPSSGGGRSTPSSQLSDEERETFRQLLLLGIDEQVIGEHLDKGSWSHIVGTFRIILHKIIRETNENHLKNHNNNNNINNSSNNIGPNQDNNGSRGGRNSRSNSESVQKQLLQKRQNGTNRHVERHQSVHVAAFDRFWAYYGRNKNNHKQNTSNRNSNCKSSHVSNKLDPNRIEETTTLAATNPSRCSKLMKMFSHTSEQSSNQSNQAIIPVPPVAKTNETNQIKSNNDENLTINEISSSIKLPMIDSANEIDPDYSMDNDRIIEVSEIDKILTTQSGVCGGGATLADFYKDDPVVAVEEKDDEVFATTSGDGDTQLTTKTNGRRSRTSTVTTIDSVNSCGGGGASVGKQSGEEGHMMVIDETKASELANQQLDASKTTKTEPETCLERTSTGLRQSFSKSLRTLKQLVTESNICGNLGGTDVVVGGAIPVEQIANKPPPPSSIGQNHSLVSQQSIPSESGPLSLNITPTSQLTASATLPPNLTAASLNYSNYDSSYTSQDNNNNNNSLDQSQHAQSLTPNYGRHNHQHKTATLQILPKPRNGPITDGNHCLPFSLLSAPYYDSANADNDSGGGAQKLRRSQTTPNVSTCYKRQSNHKNHNRCTIS